MMNRRRFLQTTIQTGAMLYAAPLGAGEAPAPSRPDEELLAEARERIERHRKAGGRIVVRRADGQPIPGAEVRVEQLQHDFLFGCNFFAFERCGEPAAEAAYRRQFAALFNYATLGFYWPAYEPQRGRPNYDYTDRVLAWCREQGLTCKGHPLVWDFADPKWLPRDFEEIRALSEARVRDIVSRFKGRLDYWDVVNEPTHLGRFKTRLGEWAQNWGAVPYTTAHLKTARAAHPNATLLVNDYRTDAAFYKILEALRHEGPELFDAVGLQSHMHDGGWPLRRVWEVCDRFAKLGLPLHFTETTFVSGPRKGPGENWHPTDGAGEARQAEYVPRFYTMLFAHPDVRALTWWDFSDRRAWQRAAAGLVRADMSPKPVYDRLQALIKRDWWTRVNGRTDAQGAFALRAFTGRLRLSARLPAGGEWTREVQWTRDQANQVELIAAS